jgi:hypothetical protein
MGSQGVAGVPDSEVGGHEDGVKRTGGFLHPFVSCVSCLRGPMSVLGAGAVVRFVGSRSVVNKQRRQNAAAGRRRGEAGFRRAHRRAGQTVRA